MTSQDRNNIQNTECYNTSYQDNYTAIFSKYMLIISEYLKHAENNIFLQNITYRKYVIKKGISTITHIFKLLLIYTKNMDMIYYNCQKSFVYYIEFIGQIGEDNHSFLQLNSKDAALFIYKKTIFEINNDIRKNYTTNENNDKLITNVDLLTTIYNTIIFRLIDNMELCDIIKIINLELPKILHKIIKLHIDSDDINILHLTLEFITHSRNNNILECLDIFVKKIKKRHNINIKSLQQTLININDLDLTPQKYITLLIKSN